MFKKVVIVGGGVLGTQIAMQCAYWGFDTTIWLRSEGSIGRTKPRIEKVHQEYKDALDKMNQTHAEEDLCHGLADSYETFDYQQSLQRLENAVSGLKLELDLAKAVKDADLVIESMSENFDAKKEMFEKLAPVMDEKTILCTNSSSLLPSKFTKYTGRPDKYLAMHFANTIWKHNTAEVMATKDTSEASFNAIVDFARDIHMVPLQLHKEKAGYLLNSVLIPFLFAGLDLVATGISSPEDVDKAWKLGTGSPEGPCEIVDVVGMQTALEITNMYVKIPGFIAPYHFKDIAKLLQQKIDEGKLGRISGEGFYKYN